MSQAMERIGDDQTAQRGQSRCLLCGAELQIYRHLHAPYDLRRCSACQLVTTWPQLSYEQLHERYETNYEQNTFHPFPLQLRRRPQVLDRIMRHISPGSMLEIGCAGGHFLSYARAQGWQVTGIELNRQMAGYARDTFHLTVHQVSVDNLSDAVPGRQFDVVYMSHVLEHLTRPDHALAKIRSFVAPGGALVLRVPNLHSLLFFLLGKHYIELYPDVHIFHFSRCTLDRLLTDQGFIVREIGTRQCDFASEGFVLMKGILDAAGIFRSVKPRSDRPASEARRSRVLARRISAPVHVLGYPLWAIGSRLGLGYELFAVATVSRGRPGSSVL